MGLWWEVARGSFRRAAAYPSAVVAGLFTNTVFGCVRAWILLAAFAASARLGGYDATDAVTFTFLTQGLIMATGGWNLGELPQRIRTGDIALDLHRPVDLQGWWLAVAVGQAGFHLLARGVVPVAVGALLFDLRWPTTAGLVAFPATVALAVLVSFGIRYLLSLACFWLLDERGLNAVAGLLSYFLSGLLLPLVLFPEWLRNVVLHLPWAMMMQVPADVWLGKHDGLVPMARTLALQAAWAAVLLLAGRAATRLAMRKVVIHGG
jgi:ABC-2 type transport system permease protein